MVTEEDLRARIKLETEQEGPTAVARRYGVDAPLIVNVLSGARRISPKLAAGMGYEKIEGFRPLGRGA